MFEIKQREDIMKYCEEVEGAIGFLGPHATLPYYIPSLMAHSLKDASNIVFATRHQGIRGQI